jgi:mediator of RNA polymerase II transcription subunit 30
MGSDNVISCALLQKLKQKNQQLKQIMDQLRNLIWEINSMLAVRS